MFYDYSSYYYIIIALQALCVIHCMRRKTQNYWIWIIVCLPLIGCIAYLFVEVISKRDISTISSNIGNTINPSGRIKDLERKLEFADTFDNKVALADAYMQAKRVDEALELYESCHVGIFKDNEYLEMKLIVAYYEKGRYDEILELGEKLRGKVDFRKTHAHVLYALTLEMKGRNDEAEKEFRTMNGRFSDFECRFHFGQFLVRAGRSDEAHEIFNSMLQEAAQMNGREKRQYSEWLGKAREELRVLAG